MASYRRSREIANRLGDGGNTAELEWCIGLMGRFPAWKFDLNRLTHCSTHGDYFISQFLCEDGHMTAVIDWTTACVHPAIWEITRSFEYTDAKTPAHLLRRGFRLSPEEPGVLLFYMKSGANSAIRATTVAHWMAVMALDMYLGTVFIVSSSE